MLSTCQQLSFKNSQRYGFADALYVDMRPDIDRLEQLQIS